MLEKGGLCNFDLDAIFGTRTHTHTHSHLHTHPLTHAKTQRPKHTHTHLHTDAYSEGNQPICAFAWLVSFCIS